MRFVRDLRLLLLAGVLSGSLVGALPVRAQELAAMRTVISARFPAVRWTTGAQLARWQRDGADVLLLDAREEAEFDVSHLRGARRVDPSAARYRLGVAPGRRIVVYCSVGWRSAAVADRLMRAGHRDVYNLEGGIFAWANAGRELRRGEASVEVVHPYDETWGLMLSAERRAPVR